MMMLSVVVRDSLSVPITRQAFLDISAAGLFLPGLVQQGHRKPVPPQGRAGSVRDIKQP